MYLGGGLFGVILEKVLGYFVGKAVDGKHIEPEEADWDWGDDLKAREFEATIAIERERTLCRAILDRINGFLNEGGTIPAYISEPLLDAIEENKRPTASGSDEFACQVLYAQSPLQLRIEHAVPGDDPQGGNSDFVVLTFYSSRELAERIQMEINRFISARGKASL